MTGLIDTPRRVQLSKRHREQLFLPPESQAASFVGTGVHKYWEECLKAFAIKDPKWECEKRITAYIQDRMISGQFDILYDRRHMWDVKTCKVWKIINDPNKIEWTQQQNMYAYMLHMNGVEIEESYILTQYLDWQKGQMVRDDRYPRAAQEEFVIDLWPREEQELYLNERVALHKSCETVPDNELPICSREDRWERHPDGATVKYAILKSRKAQRAINKGVFEYLDQAIERFKSAPGLGTDSVIEIRYAEPKRCAEWCSCSNFCNWYIDYTKRHEDNVLNDYLTYDQIHKGEF